MNEASQRTLDLCRQIASDGEISGQELWVIADWLNSNPECCDCWPGSELVPLLGGIFADGKVNRTELKRFAKKLSEVERTAAENERDKSLAEAVEKFTPLDALLPQVALILEVPSETDPSVIYSIDLEEHTCTCPDWIELRSRLHQRSIARCCKHMAYGLHRVSKKHRWPAWLGALIDNCVSRGTGVNPHDWWHVIKVRDDAILFSVGASDWCNVFAPWQGSYTRLGYNKLERRWAYGIRPYRSATITQAILAMRDSTKVLFLTDRTSAAIRPNVGPSL